MEVTSEVLTLETSSNAASLTSSTVISDLKELSWLQELWGFENKNEKLCWKPAINGWDPFRQRIQKSTDLESSPQWSDKLMMNASFTGEMQSAWVVLLHSHSAAKQFSRGTLFQLYNLVISLYMSWWKSTQPWNIEEKKAMLYMNWNYVKKMAVICCSAEPTAPNTIKKQTFIDNKSIILYSSIIVFSGTIEHGSSAEQWSGIEMLNHRFRAAFISWNICCFTKTKGKISKEK